MIKFLVVFSILTTGLYVNAAEPIVMGYGNKILSAIYDSQRFVLLLENGQLLEARKNGQKLKLGEKVYDCSVSHHGSNRGSSEMGLDCRGKLRSDSLYIQILSNVVKGKISGFLLLGPNKNTVQVELNWMDWSTGARKNPDSNVLQIKFELIQHEGWITP